MNLTIPTFALIFFVITAYGQSREEQNKRTALSKPQTQANKMDLSKITNSNVKQAIEALQANDLKAWYGFFTDKAVFTDDGRTLDFKSFFDNAFDKKERFLSIDRVENGGKDIYGNFYAGQWGSFNVFFKFHQAPEGKFDRLDIGQGK